MTSACSAAPPSVRQRMSSPSPWTEKRSAAARSRQGRASRMWALAGKDEGAYRSRAGDAGKRSRDKHARKPHGDEIVGLPDELARLLADRVVARDRRAGAPRRLGHHHHELRTGRRRPARRPRGKREEASVVLRPRLWAVADVGRDHASERVEQCADRRARRGAVIDVAEQRRVALSSASWSDLAGARVGTAAACDAG